MTFNGLSLMRPQRTHYMNGGSGLARYSVRHSQPCDTSQKYFDSKMIGNAGFAVPPEEPCPPWPTDELIGSAVAA